MLDETETIRRLRLAEINLEPGSRDVLQPLTVMLNDLAEELQGRAKIVKVPDTLAR